MKEKYVLHLKGYELESIECGSKEELELLLCYIEDDEIGYAEVINIGENMLKGKGGVLIW